MTLLAQQELLEAEPPRSVVIPRLANPAPSWWGIDSATGRLNFGWVARDAPGLTGEATAWQADGLWRGVQSVRLAPPHENEGQRLAVVREQVHELVKAMLAAGVPAPGVVYLEHPTGMHPKPMLYYVVGCAGAAVYEVVHDEGGYVPRVEWTSVAHWKSVACGTGAISKPKWGKGSATRGAPPLTWDDVREDYGVLQWARVNGYTGDARDCWDDADSLALAECARRDIAIRQ